MRFHVGLACLSLLAAGCLADEPDAAATTEESGASVVTEPAEAAAAVDAPADAALVESTRDLAGSGQFGRGVLLCPGSGVCRVDPAHEDTHLGIGSELRGPARDLEATLTWTADTPAMATLRFSAVLWEGENRTLLAEVEGASPLTLAVEAVGGARGWGLGLGVADVEPVEEPFPFHAWTTQEFEIAGTITERVPASAP